MKQILASALILISASLLSCNQEPPKLSDKEITMEVSYVDTDCDCPNFIETKHIKDNPAGKGKETERIYLEPANEVVLIPEKHYNQYNFSVRGHFYEEEALPQGYKAKTDETPKEGRVFKYDTYELVKK